MADKPLGLVTIGAALVDVLTQKDDAFLAAHGLKHGGMVLQEEAESEELYAAVGKSQIVSGGSAANTGVGFSMLGGKAAFIGRVKDDKLGHAFRQSLEDTGVQFVGKTSPSDTPTGRCIVVVTEQDGKHERTMATFLGASRELSPEDVSAQTVQRAKILFIEGYTWDSPSARSAVIRAIFTAKQAGTKVAFTLSDPFCVERHRDSFLQLIEESVDILFANEHEIEALHGHKDMHSLLKKVSDTCEVAAITFSEKGSFILGNNKVHEIAPVPTTVVDVTGAGDLYAAGVLYGIAEGWDLAKAGRLGSLTASEVISQFGGRPKKGISKLVKKA